MSRPCLPRQLPAGRRQGKKLVPACSIFWCTGLAVISPKSSTKFRILNLLEKNHNPFQKFYCIGDGTNQHVPLLWKQFVQRHLCKLYSAQHLHTNYLCNHVSLGVLHSRKCHSVSGKGGPSQDLSLHPVTLFRRAPTACKTFFFSFFPYKLGHGLSWKQALLNKGFKVHPSGTCAKKKKKDCGIQNCSWGRCVHCKALLIYSLSSIQPFHKKISAEINDNRFLLKIKFMKHAWRQET